MKSRVHLFTLALAAALLGRGCSCGDDGPQLCQGPQDCKPDELCAMDGKCIPGAECVSDAECIAKDQRKICNLESFECEFREGFADDCDQSRPCAFGEFCSTLLGRCFEAAASRSCTRRGQCPAEQFCDKRANQCVPDLGCFGDDFCETGEICDLVDHVCRAVSIECVSCFSTGTCTAPAECTNETKECLAPGVMPECRTGEECDPLGRCVQCTSTPDCGPGLFCNVALGRCESNVQCADDPSLCPDTPDVECIMCTAPEICDSRTRKCQAPATICETDVDCPGDQFCNLMLDPPICVPRIPDCLNDLFEDQRNNNRPADATQLVTASGPVYDELKLCPGDVDWYRLDVPAGTYLTIDARFRHADGDIDLQLFLPDGVTLLDESRSSNDNERVEIDVGTDRTFLLRTFLAFPSINAVPYKLIAARDPGDLCADDENEPDDGPGEAKSLTPGLPYEGRLCSADPDWFVIRSVQARTRIDVSLAFTDNLGDLDLELYRAGATTPVLRSAGSSNLEEIMYDASYAGDYWVRVVGKAADTNVYTLRASLGESTVDACTDDTFEPNDLPALATDASPILGVITPVSMCAGDEDWYLVDLGPGEGLTAEVGFSPNVDLDMALYPGDTADPSATPLRTSTGLTVREHLAYRTGAAGNYLVRVHGTDERQVSDYDLRIVRDPPFVTCPPDVADLAMRGTGFMDAFDIDPPPVRLDDLTICAGDEDWFSIVLQAGFTNVVRLQYNEADAQLDFALFDGTQQQLVQTGGAGTDSKEIAVTVNGSGFAIAFLRVFRSAGMETTYNLTIDLLPIFNCLPDVAEPNNALTEVSLVASSTITPIVLPLLTLCPSTPDIFTGGGDTDYFQITPPAAGVRINASIEFAQGDLFLELLGPAGTERACFNFGPDRCYSDGFDLTEMISFTATVAKPYYLHVGSIYSSPNVPFRPFDSDTQYTLRLDYVVP